MIRSRSLSLVRGASSGFTWRASSSYDQGKDEAQEMSDVWADGPGGFEWKSRHLAERRAVALDYMGNVGRRVPIHDAIRIRAKLGRDRLLREVSGPSPAVQHDPESDMWRPVSSYSAANSKTLDDSSGGLSNLEDDLESLLAEETVDTLAQLTDHELSLLRDEFYAQSSGGGDGGADDKEAEKRTRKMMEEWYRVRKHSSQYDAYCAVPPQERTPWSAWYLRDVKARKTDDDGNKPL